MASCTADLLGRFEHGADDMSRAAGSTDLTPLWDLLADRRAAEQRRLDSLRSLDGPGFSPSACQIDEDEKLPIGHHCSHRCSR